MVTILEEVEAYYYKDFIYLDICSRKWIYAEANEAIYGTIEASPPFGTKISKSLEKMGYQRKKMIGV